MRPAAPEYCRATPTECSPFFTKPVSSTTVKAPPIRNTKKITAAASLMPRGIAISAWNAVTGRAGTAW